MGTLEELAELIDIWLNDRRHNKLPRLASLSNVSYATVRRMAQREGEPNFTNIARILDVVTTRDKAKAFLVKHFPEVVAMIEPSLLDNETLPGITELDQFNIHDFLVIGLASAEHGISREEINDRAGQLGLHSLERLLDVGALEKLDNRYVTKAKNYRIGGDRRVLQSLGYLCELFDFERMDSKGSLFRLKTEGLTKEAVLAVYKILYEASEKIQEILDQPQNHGPYIMGVGLVSTFLSFPKGEANL